MTDHTHYETLLMKAVDGVLSDDERRAFDDHVSGCETCREELADFVAIKQTTDAMTQRILATADIEPPRERGATKLWLAISLVLMAAGLALLASFAGYRTLSDPSLPTTLKMGVGLVLVGGIGVFVFVLRLRLRAHGRDPYEEIDR